MTRILPHPGVRVRLSHRLLWRLARFIQVLLIVNVAVMLVLHIGAAVFALLAALYWSELMKGAQS